ncbi:hypothetical protein GCM10010191_66710 [Actinomadura vinacea]|uniref:Uncharacterized protein n=1 Tax=Actinomadura vinacea TaxID=115336 RepID=A0ABN3JY30_9ACTN
MYSGSRRAAASSGIVAADEAEPPPLRHEHEAAAPSGRVADRQGRGPAGAGGSRHLAAAVFHVVNRGKTLFAQTYLEVGWTNERPSAPTAP